jgi:hypothetical protein
LFDDCRTRYGRTFAWASLVGKDRECLCQRRSVVLDRCPLLGLSLIFNFVLFSACVQTCARLLVLTLLFPLLMSVRYAPLPNTQTDPLLNDEMEAAFEDDDDDHHVESRPLNPAVYSSPPRTPNPGRYDFENFDYASFPPPGSPPHPSTSSLPNDIGNSNGLIPSPSDVRHANASRPNWFRRSARVILPNALISRLHLDYEPMHGVVGGGTNNDGVFANVTAKPSRPIQRRGGSSPFLPSFRVLIPHPQMMTMPILFRKTPRKMHLHRTHLPKPTPSHLTGKRPSMRHPHQMI